MIPLARPTVLSAAITILTWKLFVVLQDFDKWKRKDGKLWSLQALARWVGLVDQFIFALDSRKEFDEKKFLTPKLTAQYP